MQDQTPLSKEATANVVFILTSFSGRKISTPMSLNSKVDLMRFKILPELLSQNSLCEAQNIAKIRFFYLGRELKNGEVLSELITNFNEMNFKDVIIHAIVSLRTTINTSLPKKSLASPSKQPEIPLENTTNTQDCVKCRIF